MAIGIDDLDWEDENELEGQEEEFNDDLEKPWIDYTNQDETFEENSEPETPLNGTEEEDLITHLLKSKGISDPSKIKFEGDNGEIEEIDWNSLSREEQISILSQNEEEQVEDQYSQDEIALIQKLREYELTPLEYEQYLLRQGANNYEQQMNENSRNYTIDDLSDDELFVMDLQARVEDITDEEAIAALEKAKSNESVYAKQMNGIREEYKRLEEDKLQKEQYEQEMQQKERFEAFSGQVQNSIRNFNSIGQLDISLSEDDVEEVAQFLLTADGAGINHFSKALNDPDTLVRMAWFALKGEDAFNDITNYFTNEIKKREQASYQKGLADAKKTTATSSKFVYQPKQNNNQNSRKQGWSIHDLD